MDAHFLHLPLLMFFSYFLFFSPVAAHTLTKPSPSCTPALDVLSQFTAPDVPAMGSAETPIDPPKWAISPPDTTLPGKGLAQHPFLAVGEGCNKIFLVNQGKVVWTYSTGKGGEYDDIWMLSNGNILFSRMGYAEEVTPQKKVVWHMDAPEGTEIHTLQPIGLDRILLIKNALPPKLMIINIKTGTVEVEHALPAISLTDQVHRQFRRVRMTAAGTYLASFLSMEKVVEYDRNFNEIWSYKTPSPWAAVRLHNGNTLISDSKTRITREVNPKGETVWEFQLPFQSPDGTLLPDSQTCVRLNNGNTVFCSRGNNGKACQFLEVTPDKKVVWALKDWTNLGPVTAVQILDDPGIPENPGDLQR